MMQNQNNDMVIWMMINQFLMKTDLTKTNLNIFTYIFVFIIILINLYFNNVTFRVFVESFFCNQKTIGSVHLQSHTSVIKTFYDKDLKRKVYSDYFIAFYYYFQNNSSEISNYTLLEERKIDSLGIDSKKGLDSNDEIETKQHYIFLPVGNKNILVSKKYNIYCDIFESRATNNDVSSSNSSSKDNNNQSDSTPSLDIYFYHYPNRFGENRNKSPEESIKIIFEFLDECLKTYKKMFEETISKQFIYEYKGSEKIVDDYKTCVGLNLIYEEYECSHNKDLDTNIFFDEKEKLMRYIEPFIFDSDKPNHPDEEKYKKAGYAFKAGLLFYGLPGCGKTSTIKGILKKTNRNGVLISLNRIKSGQELEKIFRTYTINNRKYSGKQLCFIIEDCDAFQNDCLKKRDEKNQDSDKNNSTEMILEKILTSSSEIVKSIDSNKEDKLCLATFLNILDGIIELYGIMVIFTTNHPEKIDPALLRPGRIDFKIEFKKASIKTIKQMLLNHFPSLYMNNDLLKQLDNYLLEERFSPAEVQAVLFQNINDVEGCIKQLIQTSQMKEQFR